MKNLLDDAAVLINFIQKYNPDVVGAAVVGVFFDAHYFSKNAIVENQRPGFDLLTYLEGPHVQIHPNDAGKLGRRLFRLKKDA